MVRPFTGPATLRSLAQARATLPTRRSEFATADQRRSRIFVGRVRELEVLRAAFASAASGTGRVVSVAGEPGIGKTRLLREFARLTEEQGCQVLFGTCYEGTLARAYEPFSATLDAYIRDAELGQLRADLGFGAGAIAQILPSVRQRLPDLPALEPLHPDEDWTRLYEALAQFLVALSVRSPVIVMLDDLHWADRDTLAMVRHVAHFVSQHRLLLIGTYREEELDENHPLEGLLTMLRRETNYECLCLAGFEQNDVAALIRAVVEEWYPSAEPESSPDSLPSLEAAPGWQTTVERIRLETEGSPFFVRELVLHNLETGALAFGVGSEPNWERLATSELPQGVRRVVGHRLRRLSREANRLLTAGAGMDGPFRFGIVASVAELGEDESLRALDETLEARVLRPTSDENRYDFTHALIRRAAISRLNPSRRARLHRRIAETIERLDPDRRGEIAHHFHASAALPGAERGVPHALAVADRAEKRAAFGEAVGALRIALDLLPADDPYCCLLRGRLGLALAWTLEFDEAMRVIERASESIASQRGRDEAADYLADAARVLTIAGYQRGGWICAERGLEYITPARRDGTWLWLTHFDLTRRHAEDPNDPRTFVDTSEVRDLRRIAKELVLTPLERMFLAPYFLPRTRQEVIEGKLTDVWALPCYDDQRFALQVLEEGLSECERNGRISPMIMYLACLIRAKTTAGDLAAARELLVRAQELSARLNYPSIQQASLLGAESDMLFALDDGLDEISSRVRHGILGRGAPEYNWGLAAIRAGMARAFAHLGRTDEALAVLPHLRKALDSAPGWGMAFIRITCDAAATLWLLGRTDLIEPIERGLREKILPTDLRDYFRDVRLSLAQVCALQSRFDEAQDWFAKARAVLDRAGARTLRALADYDEALMFARRAAPGDAERAQALALEALGRFSTLGMTGWTRRASELLDRTAGPADEPETRHDAEVLPTSATGPTEAILRADGDYWTIVYEGTDIRLKNLRGLQYLACLLRSPGRELHVTDLVRLIATTPGVGHRAPVERQDASVRADLGDAGPWVDPRAAAQYARRLEDLRSELSDAEECNDIGRAARARDEISFLADELKARRGRKVASHAERARVTVSKGIATALRHIRRAAPDLGEHLDATIHCGYFCVYKPDPRRPVVWEC